MTQMTADATAAGRGRWRALATRLVEQTTTT